MLKWTKQGQTEGTSSEHVEKQQKVGDRQAQGSTEISAGIFNAGQPFEQYQTELEKAKQSLQTTAFSDTTESVRPVDVRGQTTTSPQSPSYHPLSASDVAPSAYSSAETQFTPESTDIVDSPRGTDIDPNVIIKNSNTSLLSDTAAVSTSSPFPLALPPPQRPPVKMASALPDVTNLEPDSEQDTLGPEVEWEEENLTMSQIADKDSFPCLCLFEEEPRIKDGEREHLSPGLKIYSRQPVLMHTRVRKKQARARTVYKNPRGAYYEIGQTMLIPDDYQGWFELVPSDFSRATCFMSIAEVAKAMPRKFFTRSNVKGIRIEGEGENQKYLERKIVAGSVLGTVGTFNAKWKTSAETGTFKKKTKEWEYQEVTYLKCVDKDQAEILVPFTHRGKFNAIYERGHITQNAVYSMKDILTDLGLPIRVRLLFGKAPVVPCIFTGMLSIRKACADDVVLGSTMLNQRNVLFEVPLTAPVKVKYLSDDEPFQEMPTYKDAQKLCKKYATMFSKMIKLSPDLDTNQKVIQHMPTDPSLVRETDDALRALDLITDISLTSEPVDHLLDSDSASGSEDQAVVPKGGTLSELTEFRYKARESQTHV